MPHRISPHPLWRCLLCVLSITGVTHPRLAAHERPNIIYIMSDDMGYSDIGCYGSEIETPRLDTLAAQGLRFTQFYNTGRCCPTRASLLTGLYPHQAGIGHMMSDSGFPGYRGELNRNCVTIAEVLRTADYRTYMSGKWHVTQVVQPKQESDKHNWPLQRGFDRFYGTIHGAGSFFDPNSLVRDNTLISPFADPEYQPQEEYYYTDAIADQASRFVREHHTQHADQPFFMYVSFTAAHWPMHAKETDIDKYRGTYDEGYQTIRSNRYQRMLELGVIDADSTQDWPMEEGWMETDFLQWDIHNMEVYAAMIDSMDRGIGRLIDSLQETGQLDNTLILFFQDNGGCAETYGRGMNGGPRASKPPLKPLADDYLQPDMQPKQTRDGYPIRTGKGVMAGPADTYIGYGKGWATVSNTPFREYKHYTHEGGISTPLIAYWPQRISRHGELEHTPCHLIDLMATAVDISAAQYPAEFHDGQSIKPMEGKSLLPVFAGQPLEREALYWEHEGNRAIRRGDFKLVAKGVNGKWELYDIAHDRSEQHNLATAKPDLVAELSSMWDAYAERADVLPLTPYYTKNDHFNKKQLHFSLAQGDNLSRHDGPFLEKRAINFRARLSAIKDGTIAAQGGTTHGWAVYIRNGRLCFAITHDGKRSLVRTENPIEAPKGGNLEVVLSAAGQVSVWWNGRQVASGDVGRSIEEQPLDGLQIGFDLGGAVGDYMPPFTYPGRIDRVQLQLEK